MVNDLSRMEAQISFGVFLRDSSRKMIVTNGVK